MQVGTPHLPQFVLGSFLYISIIGFLKSVQPPVVSICFYLIADG
jgi:hypothetical protein